MPVGRNNGLRQRNTQTGFRHTVFLHTVVYYTVPKQVGCTYQLGVLQARHHISYVLHGSTKCERAAAAAAVRAICVFIYAAAVAGSSSDCFGTLQTSDVKMLLVSE